MRVPGLSLNLVLAVLPLTSLAADGLIAPPADTLWPQWKARISMQTTALQPVSLSSQLDGAGPQRSWQGGAVLGEYYFATPSFGSFRASGGLMFGATGGAPLLSATAGSRLGLALQATANNLASGGETPGTVPYLGLGFTSAALGSALSLSADLGWVAAQPSAAIDMGRALFGYQGRDSAWRELRLSPVLQVALRYSF